MTPIFYGVEEFDRDIDALARIILSSKRRFLLIYGVPRGGVPVAIALSRRLGIPLVDGHWDDEVSPDHEELLVVDDVVDSGKTRERFPEHAFACLHEKTQDEQATFCVHRQYDGWIQYWWEGDKDNKTASIEDAVIRQLQYIGEDPTREGLLETPARVVRAWGELYAGYQQDPLKVLKSFEEGACDEMVVLKDIELYSTCEHHMLPFYGRAHVGYIPDGKVVGVSKLARLVDIFARRLQIQERLGQQVTSTLMDGLKPKGAACVIEAQHLCMKCRGVGKQHSMMVTSSLRGVFLENPAARAEFMGFIR